MSPFAYYLTNPYQIEAIIDTKSMLKPTKEQVCIKTIYSAISPGTELAAYKGEPPLRPTKKIYPRLLGYCNVSKIIDIGPKNKGWSVGDLVLSHSAHRSHDRINISEIICKIPKNADLPSVSTTYLFHLGYNACLKAKVIAGHNVAVIGLGTLGLTSGSAANIFGANVFGFSNSIEKNLEPKKFGFKKIYSKSLNDLNNIADIVITTSNSWDDWILALQLVRQEGKIAVLGFPGRNQNKPPMNPLSSEYFYDKQITILSCGYSPNYNVPMNDIRFTLKRNCEFLMSTILEKKLPAQNLIFEIREAKKLKLVYDEMVHSRHNSRTFVLDWRRIK